MRTAPERRPREMARNPNTYRGWRRNNALSWEGVPTKKKVHFTTLFRQVSARGEVHYQNAGRNLIPF